MTKTKINAVDMQRKKQIPDIDLIGRLGESEHCES